MLAWFPACQQASRAVLASAKPLSPGRSAPAELGRRSPGGARPISGHFALQDCSDFACSGQDQNQLFNNSTVAYWP